MLSNYRQLFTAKAMLSDLGDAVIKAKSIQKHHVNTSVHTTNYLERKIEASEHQQWLPLSFFGIMTNRNPIALARPPTASCVPHF
jgi:hypothetical protein